MVLKILFSISINLMLLKFTVQAATIEIPQSEIDSASSKISNESPKLSLRYGFHRTHECQDYAKAYVCIQKCVDLKYDIAYSNKNCSCFCITKKEKAKYTPLQIFTKTKWKLGAPTTTRPAWVEKYKNIAGKKTTSKKVTKKITVTEESVKDTKDSEEILTNASKLFNKEVDFPSKNSGNSSSDLNTQPNKGENFTESDPTKNSNNSSAVETTPNDSDNSLDASTQLANSEKSSASEIQPNNTEINSSTVENIYEIGDNSSTVDITPKNSDNSSATDTSTQHGGGSTVPNVTSGNGDNSSSTDNPP